MDKFMIAEMHGLPSYASRFRIVEKLSTIDGQRDRFTNKSFATLAEALEFIKELETHKPQVQQQVTSDSWLGSALDRYVVQLKEKPRG